MSVLVGLGGSADVLEGFICTLILVLYLKLFLR